LYLAGFVPFLKAHIGHPQIRQLIQHSLVDYLHNFCLAKNVEHIKMIGSIAFLFKDLLISEAAKLNITIEEVIQSPIDQLTKYHLNNG
jgi:cysteinyl-tRNA synthetase